MGKAIFNSTFVLNFFFLTFEESGAQINMALDLTLFEPWPPLIEDFYYPLTISPFYTKDKYFSFAKISMSLC